MNVSVKSTGSYANARKVITLSSSFISAGPPVEISIENLWMDKV